MNRIYRNHKYKVICQMCGLSWFSNRVELYLNQCFNQNCEEAERIIIIPITSSDLLEIEAIDVHIKRLIEEIKLLKRDREKLPWIKELV